MPTFRRPVHPSDDSTEARFLAWTDRLVDPSSLPERGTTQAPDPDITDVAETATTVHRAVGIGTATPLPADRTDAIWEQLMNTTVSPTALSGAATGASRPRNGADRPFLPTPRPGWSSYLLTAALIAVIVIAGAATIWRITDPLNGNGPGTSSQPGFLASATPAQETSDGCPLTSDMFVVIESEASPGEVPSLLPTTALVRANGDFIITCDEAPDPEPLMTGVTGAGSLPWPGTVLLELEDGNSIVYNIATGQQLDLGDFDRASGPLQTNVGSPWLATPNNAGFTDWRITHLGTMESMILSEEIGGVLPTAFVPEFAWSPGSSFAVMTQSASHGLSDTLPPNAGDATIAELPADTLILNETFETRRWIDNWGEVAVSGDGEAIVYQETDPVQPLRVVDAQTGEVLAELDNFNMNSRAPSRFAFSGDGASLVYLNGNNVWLETYNDETTTTMLETDGMRPDEVHATGVPGRVLVKQVTELAFGRPGYPSNPAPLSIINAETGDVTEVEGFHIPYGFGIDDPWQHLEYIVTMSPAPESDEKTVMRLTDIATGEVVLTSEPVEGTIAMVLNRIPQATFADNGAITLVAIRDGPSILFDVAADEVGTISTPDTDDEGIAWTIWLAPDGGFLYAVGLQQSSGLAVATPSSGDLFTFAPVSIDPQWAAPSDNIPSVFIRGVQPQDPEEPTMLEAQDITPLEATPAP